MSITPSPDTDICGARRKDGQGVCGLRAGWGTDHVGFGQCKLHAGSVPQGKAKAAMLRARWELSEWGGRLDVTPAEALLELVQTKAAEVAFWQYKVAALSDSERVGLLVTATVDESGSSTQQGSFDRTMETRTYEMNAYLKALHKAQEQLANFSAAALRAGVDEALVRIAAVQATAVIEFARKAMDAARLNPQANPDVILLELVNQETNS